VEHGRDGQLTWSQVTALNGQGKLLPTAVLSFSAASLATYAYGMRALEPGPGVGVARTAHGRASVRGRY
jgi:hypothetical protein